IQALSTPPDLDPFDQELQLRPVHLARAHRAPVAQKFARLQPLAPHAVAAAVKVQDAHLCGFAVHVHVERAVHRVTAQGVAHQGTEPIKAFSHIARLAVQVHADTALRKEHQPRATLSTMPWPRSNRTSHPDVGALSAPKSMKEVGSAHAATGVTSARTPLPSSATRQRWNTFLLIPSRRQNSEAVRPLAAWRENSSRHIASLRRIRLVVFIAPVSSTITGRDYPQWTDLRKYVAELPVTACPRIARHWCASISTPSRERSKSSSSRPMPPSSTPPSTSGVISSTTSWPIAAPRTSPIRKPVLATACVPCSVARP